MRTKGWSEMTGSTVCKIVGIIANCSKKKIQFCNIFDTGINIYHKCRTIWWTNRLPICQTSFRKISNVFLIYCISLYYSYPLYPRTQWIYCRHSIIRILCIHVPSCKRKDREEQKKREAEKSEWQPPKSESSSDEGDTDEELAQDEDLRK